MSNGRQIGSIVGSLIAAYFTAGTSYAAFAVAAGGAIGGAVGGAIDPEKIMGPRLDDPKITLSTYGVTIPRLYGTDRFGGYVVWCTDRQEIERTEDVGKGSGAEQTTWEYYVHMRVLLCERHPDGTPVALKQIFRDGKLVWDASSGLSVGQALASSESSFSSSAVLYQGEETQMPDPYEEQFDGVGNAPPFRDFATISLRFVECPGGRVPQFSFVFSNNYTTGVEKGVLATVPKVINENAIALVGMAQTLHISEQTVGSSYFLKQTLIGNGYATPLSTINLPARGDACSPVTGTEYGNAFVVRDAGDYSGSSSDYYSHPKWVELIDLQTGEATHLFDYIGTDPQHVFLGANLLAAYDKLTGAYAVAAGTDISAGNVYALNPVVLYGGAHSVTTPTPGGVITSIAMYGGVLAILNLRGGVYYVRRYSASTFNLIDEVAGPPIGGGANEYKSALRFDSNGLFAWVRIGAGASLYAVGSGWNLLSSDVETITGQKELRPTTFYTDGSICVIGPSDNANRSYDLIHIKAVTSVQFKVKDFIAAEMDRIGESRYSVDAIPDGDVFTGLKIANQSSTRAAISQVLTAFQIYTVDEDGLIKFKKYSAIQAEAFVSYDELGQYADSGDGNDIFPLQRTQAIDLPRSVTVNYTQPGLDFNAASESDARQTVEAIEDQSVDLAIAMDSSIAKRAAQSILYAAWNAQNARSASVSRKFSFLSPGDGVNIEYPRGTVGLWRILSANDDGRVVRWTVEPGDAQLFTQTAVGTTDFNGQSMAELPAPTRIQPLDMPIVRDQDNDAGLYVAMDSYGSVPAKAELFVGDEDTNLQSRGTVSASSPIGFAETVLGDWQRTLVDETNLVTINIGDDEFSSVTRDVLLAGGAQFWACGVPGRWEIGASAQADDLGGGRFILSRHLRGLFGTEQHAATHAANDTFVLLRNVGILRPNSGVGALGQSKRYRAVTLGRSFDSAPSISYTNTGEGLKPLRPVNLRRSNTNDLSVDRRSRLAMNNLTGALPLGESTEAYLWAFYSSGSFATLLGTVTTNTATVTSAQMTAIGVTPTATLYVRVSQISDSVGAGHELQASI